MFDPKKKDVFEFPRVEDFFPSPDKDNGLQDYLDEQARFADLSEKVANDPFGAQKHIDRYIDDYVSDYLADMKAQEKAYEQYYEAAVAHADSLVGA